MSKYIEFKPLTPNPKTKRWSVTPRDGSPDIGVIEWYGPWRKYCFMPDANCVFEEVCLRDIAAFIEQQTRLHRAALKRPSEPMLIPMETT